MTQMDLIKRSKKLGMDAIIESIEKNKTQQLQLN